MLQADSEPAFARDHLKHTTSASISQQKRGFAVFRLIKTIRILERDCSKTVCMRNGLHRAKE